MKKITLMLLMALFIGSAYSQSYRVHTNYLGEYGNVSTNNVIPNQWHYIAVTKSNNLNGKIYIDGVLVRDSIMENVSYNYTQLYLAVSNCGGYAGYFKGYIDELRVSNVVRSQTEIQNYYSSNQPFTSDANTFGLWHFDETSGTVINNAMGGSGSISGGASIQSGKFGNCVYYDGIDGKGDCNVNIPESDITIEFWFKHDGTNPNDVTLIQPFGSYSSNIGLWIDESTVSVYENFSTINTINVFPNPNNGTFQIAFDVPTNQNVKIDVFNNIGQSVFTDSKSNFNGQFNQSIDLSTFSKGVYLVNTRIGDKTFTNKIAIQK